MIARTDITGAVLAGGQGQRMGGVDKGQTPLAGRALAAWALDALRPQVGPLLVSANRSLDAYRALGAPVVSDRRPGWLGPLAGLDAVAVATDTPYLLVTPCDTPRLPRHLAARLVRGLIATGADIAVIELAGRLQPLHALLRVAVAADLGAALDAGVRKPVDWYDRHRWVSVPWDGDAGAFSNVNTEAQRRALEEAMPWPRAGRQNACG